VVFSRDELAFIAHSGLPYRVGTKSPYTVWVVNGTDGAVLSRLSEVCPW